MTRHTKPAISQRPSHRLALHAHLAKHFHKHAHRIIASYTSFTHLFLHCWELMIVLFAWFFSVMLAGFTWSLDGFMRTSDVDVASYLAQAIANPQNMLTQGNLISVWKVPTTVFTSFTTGYCTYGAARISPEFFPYVDSTTQQRTWWGNAVDRCANAAATGYKIGNTPKVWSLIVYNGWGKFGPYGHVGKVMYYDRTLNKIIIRDMAWVNTFMMSDHRGDANDTSIECFIYNSRALPSSASTPSTDITSWTTTPITTPVQTPSDSTSSHTAAPVVSAGNTSSPTDTSPTNTSTTTPTTTSSSTTVSPSQTTTSPTPPSATTAPEVSTPVVVTTQNKDIDLDFSKLDDMGNFFVSQRDIKVHSALQSPLRVGASQDIILEITDKKTWANFDGLLPFTIEFMTSHDSIGVDYASIQLVQDGTFTIHVAAQKVGKAVLLITLGGEKIAKIPFTVE